MSKYDKEREKLGLKPLGPASSSSVSTKSKYADEREQIRNGARVVQTKVSTPAKSFNEPGRTSPIIGSFEAIQDYQEQHRVQPSQPSVQPDFLKPKAPLNAIASLRQYEAEHPEIMEKELPGRDLPNLSTLYGIGNFLKGLDKIQQATEPAAKLAQQFYVPGGGPAAISGFTRGVSSAVSRLAPKIGMGENLGAKVARGAITEAAAGVPLGAGQTLASNPGASGKEVAEGAAVGGALGAAGGAIVPAAAKGLGPVFSRLLKRNGVPDEQAHEILALPLGRADAARARSANVPGTEPVTNPYTFALPEPSIAAPTTARAARRVNPYQQQFESLIGRAQQLQQEGKLTPGREEEDLASIWSQMAGREAPSLDELINLAYKPRPSRVKPNLAAQARSYQAAREVAGAPLPVKSVADRMPRQGVVASADAPVTLPKGVRPEAEAAVPQTAAEETTAAKVTPESAAATAPVESLVKQYTDADQVMKELDQRYSSPGAEMPVEDLQKYVEAMNTKSTLAERIQRFVETGSEDVQAMRREARNLPEGVQAKTNMPVPAASSVPTAGGQVPGTPTLPSVPPGSPVPPAKPTPAASTKTISRTGLVASFRKNLGVTIDTGRMGVSKKLVAGIYKTQPEVIRTGTQGEYETLAHESGHDLTKRFNLKRQPALEQELVHMMDVQNVHDYKQYPQSQWFDEGIAEYFRTYLSDPAQARQLAPQFSAFLESALPMKIQKGLDAVHKDVRTWIDQGAYNRAQGKIDFDSGSRKEGFKWSKWYTRFVDDLHPLELMEKALTGKIAMGKNSFYKLARNSRGVAERAKMAVTRGVYDDAGNKLSEGLSTIVKPLEDVGMKEKDLATYLAVKHAQDLKMLNKEVPFADDEISEVLARWDHIPEVRQVHADIIKFNDALLKILLDAGIQTTEKIQIMKNRYPNYVPFYRHFDDDTLAGFKDGGGFGGGNAFANITTPIRQMSEEGSDRTLINPVESMVKNTFLAMNAAAKNRVGLQLSELAKIDGAGAWVELVPGQKSAREHIIDVYQNGKKQAYKIRDPELYNAMLSLDNESTSAVIKFLGGVASLLRGGATLTPEFMVRNVFRDVAGALVNSSKYGFNPLDFFKGLFHVITKSETFDRFVSSGGAMSTMMALDRDANREAMEAVFKLSLKDKTMNVITDPKELAKWLSLVRPVQKTVGALRKGAEISELSTKVGKAKRVLEKTGDLDEAAFQARDLMDFNRAGSVVRNWNKATAFLNASIQGTDKMRRAFLENPAGFLIRAFVTLVLPASAVYFWNKYNLSDEERATYENIPQWQKDTFYVVGIPGTGEFVRIPKPFESGMLFATGTERTLRWLEDNDPEAFRAYGQATAEAYAPPMLFTALTPLMEAITNHSFFRNAPVVPMGEERLEKKDQYGVYTSELSKDIAKFLSLTKDKPIDLSKTNFASPRIIDNTIRGYTAGLGQYGVDLIDEGIKAVTGRETTPLPAKKLTEQPVARSFFASTAGGGQVRDDFYDQWGDLSRERASADFNEEPFEHQAEYNRMKPYQKEISRLQKQYKQIQKSKVLDPHAKRSQLDALDDKMNAAAKKALGK